MNDALVAKVRHDGTVATGGGAYTVSTAQMIPGVVPGPKYVIVRCDINNQIPEGEAGEANNIGVSAATTHIQIIELTLGVPFNAALAASGVAHYYQVTVPANETLLVTLDAATPFGANELYIRFGEIPDRGHYDAAYANPFLPDQQVTIPTTQAGTYYILVYGDNVPSPPAAYTILAQSLPFGITEVKPDTASNTAAVTVKITGARFESETDFSLIAEDDTPIQPEATYPQSQSVAFATFDLRGASVGPADVKAVNSDASETTASGLFEIVSGGGAHLVGQIIAPSTVRTGRPFPVRIEYANTVDADPPGSVVAALPAETDDPALPLTWSGQDVEGGSGLAGFTIYVSVDGGPFLPFLFNTTATAVVYTAQPGHTYAFYSVASDNAGNVEAVPAVPDASTTVLVALAVAEVKVNGGLTQRSNVTDVQVRFTADTNLQELLAVQVEALTQGVVSFSAGKADVAEAIGIPDGFLLQQPGAVNVDFGTGVGLTVIPEPATLTLAVVSGLVLAALRRRTGA